MHVPKFCGLFFLSHCLFPHILSFEFLVVFHQGHKKWITGISWEPAHLQAPCLRFVSSSKDGDARIWNVSSRKCVISLTGHTLSITCVKWGGDGMIYTG